MGNPGSWAVVLPDKAPQQVSQLMQTLYTRNMQQQRQQALMQQRELVRQQNLAKFVGDNFKDANHATGTAADTVINQLTSTAREKFAKLVHDNPNMDEGELEMQMQKDLGQISQYSAAIKAGRKNIEDGAAHYQQMPGIDADGLKQAAIHNMLYTTDGNGKQTLKPLDQIDLGKDYLGDTLNSNPELFVHGDDPYTSTIDKFKPTKGGNGVTTEYKGVTTENKYTDQVYPWQTLKKDDNGRVVGVQTTGQPATVDGQPLTDPETGKPMQIVDDNTFSQFSGKNNQAAIRRDVNAYITKNGYKPEDFPAGSEGYNVLAKHILYNKLDKDTPKDFLPEHKVTDNSLVTKMQLGMVDALGRTMSKADERREAELLGSKNAKIRLAANFDPTVIQAGEPYTDPTTGKQFIDVTNAVGGFNTLADKKGSQYEPAYKKVSRVMVDPTNPGTIYTEEDGHIIPYTGKAIDALLTRHAPANDYKSLKEVDEINNKIPITVNTQAARAARAELEYKRRQAQAATTTDIPNLQ